MVERTRVQRAVILAAGTGSRLVANEEYPKPLKPVGGVPMLVRVLRTLQSEGIREAVVVVGYRADAIKKALLVEPDLGLKLQFVENPDYTKRNGVSLLAAREFIDQECILSMADHVYSPEIVRRLRSFDLPAGGGALAIDYDIDRCFDIDDATKVRMAQGRIVDIGKELPEYNAIDTGVFRIGPSLVEELDRIYRATGDVSLSCGVHALARRGLFLGCDAGDARWIDVDTPEAFQRAEAMVRVFGDDLGDEPAGNRTIDPDAMELFAPSWVRAAQPYKEDHFEKAASRDGLLRMMSNENPFAPSERVLRAVIDAASKGHLYPSSGKDLRAKLGGREGLSTDHVVLGAGSTEVIDLVIRTFVAPGEEVLLSVPTFSMYEARTRVVGGVPVLVPMTEDHDFDVPALLSAITERTKVIFLCTPNNPTGNRLQESQIRRILRLGLPTVIDEAYYEFGETVESLSHLLAEFPNAICIRTFSKAFGLAGLRLGYGLAHPAVIRLMMRVKVPWNVPATTIAGAMAALDDAAEFEARMALLREGRNYLVQEFSRMQGLEVMPSEGNFVLIDSHGTGIGSEDILQAMFTDGVFIRSLAVHRAGRGFLRVTVGTPEENRRCVEVMRSALARLRRRGEPRAPRPSAAFPGDAELTSGRFWRTDHLSRTGRSSGRERVRLTPVSFSSQRSGRPAVSRAARTAGLLVALLCASNAGAGVWPTEIDKLARQLESSDLGERRAAATRLSGIPPHLAGALVTKALEDPDPDVRIAAAGAVVAHRGRAPEDAVLPWLNETDSRLRLAGCQVLRVGPSPKAVTALARVLGDGDARVRQAAASALGNGKSAEAVVALLGHLDDPSADTRVAVVDALFRLADKRAVVPLVGKVQDSSPDVRRAVVRALGELGDARAASALLLALRDALTEVRVDALAALGAIGDASSTLAIAPLCDKDSPPDVRRAALAALGKIGGKTALGFLVAALDRDEVGAAPARDALVAMGDAAVAPLSAVLAAPASERAAASAAEALGMLRAPGAREPIVAALRKGTVSPTAALRALSSLGDPDALPVALERITDRATSIRSEARRTAETLLELRPSAHAVDPLAAALGDPRVPAGERVELLRLIGKTRAARAAKVLAASAGASSPATQRLAAIEALGALGPAGEDPILLEALEDESPLTRARAGVALGASAAEGTTRALVERAISAERQDRGALAAALAGALGRATERETIERAFVLLAGADGAMRDAVLEGLGRSSHENARGILVKLATSPVGADRRKVAEGLAAHPAGAERLRALSSDPDAGVRAAATWSLGRVGGAEDRARLSAALSDPNAAVAANAAISVGRLAARLGSAEERGPLCAALRDGRAYVRAAALTGLATAKLRCDPEGEPERALLAEDPSASVRAAAATLLSSSPPAEDGKDRRALSRCRMEDPFGSVANRCARPRPRPAETDAISVLVVPEGGSRAAAEAPFALVLADGAVRHGVADRRGVVFELAAPRGAVSLDVPAPLAR